MDPQQLKATIAAAKAGTDDAFGRLLEAYGPRLYGYFFRATTNHHDAEDLTAKTFHRAMNHFPRYVDRGAPFSAWLYRIAHNVVANWHRDRSRQRVVPLEEVPLPSVKRDDPARVAQDRDRQEELLSAVRRLPADRQQLLMLKFVEQMSNLQIAEVMGRTEGAIKSLYHRTLVALRADMLGNGGSEGRPEWSRLRLEQSG